MAKLVDGRSGLLESSKGLRLLVLLALLLGGLASAQAPVFVEIRSEAEGVPFGGELELEVVLLDEDNEAAPSPQEYRIALVMRLGEDELASLGEVVIPAGISSVDVLLQVSDAGELSISSEVEVMPSEEPAGVSEPGVVSLLALHPDLFERELFLFIGAPGEARHKVPSALLEELWAATPGPTPAVAEPLGFTLHYGQIPVVADGRDGARLRLFLFDADGQVLRASQDITILLSTTLGRFEPNEIVIPEGSFAAEARLLSDHPGEAIIRHVGSLPANVELRNAAELQPIVFTPARWRVLANPTSVSLLEPSEIVVRLHQAPDSDQTVTLSISQGRGVVRPAQLVIHKGEREGRAKFFPIWTGNVMVSAFSEDGRPQEVYIDVTLLLALLWLLLSLLGGFAGAWVAVFVGKDKKRNALWARRRMLVGMLTGFVLYWALIFGVVPLSSLAVAGAVLNPFSAFVLSALGGWIGADIFTLLLQRLGMTQPAGS